MERRRCSDLKCAALCLSLVLAAALHCSAGRDISTQDLAACAEDACNSAHAESKAVVNQLENSVQDAFAMDYSYNPGSPRPVPQAPRGRAPRIGVPPSPPTVDITPQVPPPPIIVSSSPPPPASESFPPPAPPSIQAPPPLPIPPNVPPTGSIPPPLFGAPPLPPFPFPLAPPPPAA